MFVMKLHKIKQGKFENSPYFGCNNKEKFLMAKLESFIKYVAIAIGRALKLVVTYE